jgi:putative N6-adenine-specific DNA methylase
MPLLDPMCGSGTFLLEAALMAHDIAPGWRASSAFQRWSRSIRAMAGLLDGSKAREARRATTIYGSDISPVEAERARQNLAAAGLHESVDCDAPTCSRWQAPAAEGVMVANPPYGVRLDEQERLAAFYPRLGDALKQRFAGWRCYFISADTQLPKLIGLKASKRTPLYNGALECRLYEYRIDCRLDAGRNRRLRRCRGARSRRRSRSLASLPCSLICRRRSFTESALRSASS